MSDDPNDFVPPPRPFEPFDPEAFTYEPGTNLQGLNISVAVDVATDELIVFIPHTHIRVTQVVHEEGILKLRVKRLPIVAP